MYENAWQVRGYEPFLMDLLVQREWAELLLDRFCDEQRPQRCCGGPRRAMTASVSATTWPTRTR